MAFFFETFFVVILGCELPILLLLLRALLLTVLIQTANPSDGKWEPVEVPDFDPLNDEVEDVPDEAEKGKGNSAA